MATLRTSLDQWAVLAAVIDQGGYAQAAALLNKSQPAVSYALARLQEALDVPLLVVEGRKAVLTEHGRVLLQRARPLLRDLETLERLAGKLKQGWEPELRLVVDVAFPRSLLLAIVAELQQLCPSTQMQLSDAVLSGAEQAIEDAAADVVVTSRVPPGFLGSFLMDIRFIAVAAPRHPLFEVEVPLTTSHLARHVQVVVRDSGQKRPRNEGWLGADRRCTVSSIEASLATVKAGLGYAWLPEHLLADALREGSAQPLPLAVGGERNMELYLVTVRPELAGPAAQAAVECFHRHVPVARK
ncbi:LysR family transcriptional regulator [Nevskia sp.]|uniref:LysR family transcriptional regulator n=1 Tax=Nevskia sp. TaxID=1929292 RepID=UPI003F71F3CE